MNIKLKLTTVLFNLVSVMEFLISVMGNFEIFPIRKEGKRLTTKKTSLFIRKPFVF